MKRCALIGIAVCGILLAPFGYHALSHFIASHSLIWRLDQIYENPNPIIRHFSPTWRSIKKIGDLWYLPRIAFHRSTLPTYEIELSKNDLKALLDALPQSEEGERFFTDDNKQSVAGKFRSGEFSANAKIRYRGVISNHWNAVKKSWQINLPEDAPFEGRTTIRLFIPEDRWWTAEFLEARRAREFGVLTPDLAFIKLKVNGKDYGVYMSIEALDTEFLESHGRVVGEIYSELDLQKRIDYLQLQHTSQWQARIDPLTDTHKDALAYFLYVISQTSNAEFEKRIPTILDIDAFEGWVLESLLARNYHQKNQGNLNFYFDPSRGVFEPIAYDMFSLELGNTYQVKDNRLLNRMMRIDWLRKRIEEKARVYVSNSKNLENDLTYYEDTTNALAPDIIADTAKLPPTSAFFAYYREHRGVIMRNFQKIKEWLSGNGSLPLTTADESYPLPQPQNQTEAKYDFSSWDALHAPLETFTARHPQFGILGKNIVSIGPGTFAFTGDVVLPLNTELIVRPGTHLYFGTGSSLVVSGPIQSIGTQSQPITFDAINIWKPWGGVVILHSNKESSFAFNIFRGGGAKKHLRGIDFNGMLSAYASPLHFEWGTISNSAGSGIASINAKSMIRNTAFDSNKTVSLQIQNGDGVTEKSAFINAETHIKNVRSSLRASDITMTNCMKYGFEVSNQSSAILQKTIIGLCKYALTAYNASHIEISDSVFVGNDVGIKASRKDQRFDAGGSVTVEKSVFWQNKKDTENDPDSAIKILNSVMETDSTQKPNFDILLPPQLKKRLSL